mmetsp:Transcript_28249/g.67854  ORF Transcript_28249/g.67854 Transcript_28249/m.67854 type:complete len:199 (-) Transcript_28249:123-719(-)
MGQQCAGFSRYATEVPSVREQLAERMAVIEEQNLADDNEALQGLGQHPNAVCPKPKTISLALSEVQWTDLPELVKIYISKPGVVAAAEQSGAMLVDFGPSSVKMTVAEKGTTYVLDLNPLFDTIEPDFCSSKTVKGKRVTLTLKKARSESWTQLMASKPGTRTTPGPTATERMSVVATAPLVVTSSSPRVEAIPEEVQ